DRARVRGRPRGPLQASLRLGTQVEERRVRPLPRGHDLLQPPTVRLFFGAGAARCRGGLRRGRARVLGALESASTRQRVGLSKLTSCTRGAQGPTSATRTP